jgi:hypothetical protein
LLLKEAATAMSSIEHGVAIGANTWFSILAGNSLNGASFQAVEELRYRRIYQRLQ